MRREPENTARARDDESDADMLVDAPKPWGAGVHIDRALTEEPDEDPNAGSQRKDASDGAEMDIDNNEEDAEPSQAPSATRVEDDAQVAESAQGMC